MSRFSHTWLPDVMMSTPALNRSSAVCGVSPLPPAAFSPLAITRSIARSRRISGSRPLTVRRPSLPTTSPIMRTFSAFASLPGWVSRLLRVLDRAPLADNRYLYLARVVKAFLYAPAYFLRHAGGAEIVHFLRLDDYPDLAAGLNRERLVDSREAVCDGLEGFQPFDVLV